MNFHRICEDVNVMNRTIDFKKTRQRVKLSPAVCNDSWSSSWRALPLTCDTASSVCARCVGCCKTSWIAGNSAPTERNQSMNHWKLRSNWKKSIDESLETPLQLKEINRWITGNSAPTERNQSMNHWKLRSNWKKSIDESLETPLQLKEINRWITGNSAPTERN